MINFHIFFQIFSFFFERTALTRLRVSKDNLRIVLWEINNFQGKKQYVNSTN